LDQGFFDPWFVYPMNRIIFQPDGSRMYPIFHCFIIPIVSAENFQPQFNIQFAGPVDMGSANSYTAVTDELGGVELTRYW
jgi:hypothetical protein